MQVWRSVLVAGHGGTVALLYGAPAITGHGEASRGAHEIHGDLVMLFQLHKPDERLRQAPATARWREGENAATRITVFHAGETTNGGNTITRANTHPNQALMPITRRKARVSQAVASSPWRHPWRPRFPAIGEKANMPSPKLY